MSNFYKYVSLFLFFLLVISNLFLISKYEKLLVDSKQVDTNDVEPPKFTKEQVVSKIMQLPNYQLDSITVFEDGVIASNVAEIQGGISHTYLNNEVQLAALKMEALNTKEPLGYLVYKHVIPYYIQQFGNKRDSIR